MKKINNRGFILAETLIVSVFVMLLFTMIYNNFFPLIGEYEKRENYDDVDGKYTAYWIKKLIESADYSLTQEDISAINKVGFTRFSCSNLSNENSQRSICIDLVKSLEISGCNNKGEECDAFITRYKLDGVIVSPSGPKVTKLFKSYVRAPYFRKYYIYCASTIDVDSVTSSDFQSMAFENELSCGSVYFQKCCSSYGLNSCTKPVIGSSDYENFYRDSIKTDEKTKISEICAKNVNKKVFSSSFKDYILSLPNYSIPHHTTGAAYRVVVAVHHKKDNNDYYSYSNMEVNK